MATKRKKKPTSEGTYHGPAQREASGRPLVSYSIAAATRDEIVRLAEALDVGRGRVIDQAIEAYAKTIEKDEA